MEDPRGASAHHRLPRAAERIGLVNEVVALRRSKNPKTEINEPELLVPQVGDRADDKRDKDEQAKVDIKPDRHVHHFGTSIVSLIRSDTTAAL